MVAAKKMSGGVVDPNVIHLCLSTKSLNAALPDPEYNLPPIAELFGRLHGERSITSLDGKKAYHLLTLDKGSRDKTAFTAPDMRRWQWKRTFFRKSIIASHFPWLMESILAEWRDNVRVCIDDIIIFSKEESVEAHAALVGEVEKLTTLGFKLSLKKCQFGFKKLQILGFILEGEKRTVDPRKVGRLRDIPRPTSGKALEAWLGSVCYLREARSPYGGRKKGSCVLCSEPRSPQDWPTHQSHECPG